VEGVCEIEGETEKKRERERERERDGGRRKRAKVRESVWTRMFNFLLHLFFIISVHFVCMITMDLPFLLEAHDAAAMDDFGFCDE
jgi:hypothetical protein